MSPSLSTLLLLLSMAISATVALPLLHKATPAPPALIPQQQEDIPDLMPELEDEYPDIEKRDLEELYPFGVPSDLIDLLPELPRTDRKPRLEPAMLLSARQQILPYI